MKKILLLIGLFFLALQVYSLNASENRRPEGVIVTTTFEPGPDINSFSLRKVR